MTKLQIKFIFLIMYEKLDLKYMFFNICIIVWIKLPLFKSNKFSNYPAEQIPFSYLSALLTPSLYNLLTFIWNFISACIVYLVFDNKTNEIKMPNIKRKSIYQNNIQYNNF